MKNKTLFSWYWEPLDKIICKLFKIDKTSPKVKQNIAKNIEKAKSHSEVVFFPMLFIAILFFLYPIYVILPYIFDSIQLRLIVPACIGAVMYYDGMFWVSQDNTH